MRGFEITLRPSRHLLLSLELQQTFIMCSEVADTNAKELLLFKNVRNDYSNVADSYFSLQLFSVPPLRVIETLGSFRGPPHRLRYSEFRRGIGGLLSSVSCQKNIYIRGMTDNSEPYALGLT